MNWLQWLALIAAAIAGILVMGAAIDEIVNFLGDDDFSDRDPSA